MRSVRVSLSCAQACVEYAAVDNRIFGEKRELVVTNQPAVGPRNIPEPIKREVRQRCGFGCVLCGLPLYEYDHLLGWANVHRHAPDEIVLLCDRHHTERTSRLLPDEAVTAANQDPFNLRSGVSPAYDLHYFGIECAVILGDNLFATEYKEGTLLAPIAIDSMMPVTFTLSDEHLLLSVLLFDETNRPVLKIEQNQLIYTVDRWDIEFVGRRLVIRTGRRDIFIDITFDPPNGIIFNRGRILFNGVELLLAENYVWLSNNQSLIRGSFFRGNLGIIIGPPDPPGPCAVRIPNANRYLGKSPRAGHIVARRVLAESEQRMQEMERHRQTSAGDSQPSQAD